MTRAHLASLVLGLLAATPLGAAPSTAAAASAAAPTAATSRGAAAPALPKEGTFEGTWHASGTVQKVPMRGATVTLARLDGQIELQSGDGLARQFEAVCNSVTDPKTGGAGRCVWTDASGDTIQFEVSGAPLGSAGTVREANGLVVGGTGRYAGIRGEFHVDWLFVESTADDSRFSGYITKLEGHWLRP
jgi:hypothetical protein